MKLIKRISVAQVVNLTAKEIETLEGERHLMRVIGIARSYELGMSQFGEFIRFKGEFRATNLETGELYAAPVCFLPEPADGLLKTQLDELGNDSKTPVEFAFDISIVPHDGERGYQYRVTTLMDSQPSDPLATLMQQVGVPEVQASQTALALENDAEGIEATDENTSLADKPKPKAGKK